MKLFNFSAQFSTEGKKPGFKKANKFFTILMLIGIAFAMIGIWGEIAETYTYNSITYSGSYTYIGIEYYIYSGWRTLINSNALIGNYVAMGLACFLFLIALIITYICGIKAFVRGVKNIANNEDCSIFGDFLVIALVQFTYFTLAEILISINLDSYMSVGWGKILCGMTLWPIMIAVVIYHTILSFDKKRIPEFVGKLFLTVGSILCLGIISYAQEGYFVGDGIIEAFKIAAKNHYDASTFNMFTFQGILEISIVFVSIFVLSQTAFIIVKGYPKGNFLPLVALILLLGLNLAAMTTNGIAKEMIEPNNVVVSSNVINSFVCLSVLSSIYLANYIITKK